ncbi:lariat debranching enzyme B-like [Biomphalaria glabrata]|uniref:Lariat debranching enzyme B-like n=1 Tax=Biomphalaria glabrata TaxID=6526 RepID=A0A9W2Z6F4_BIOGL|nr:lariat debranching enzyme B-like [Biomphalaria glabrata]XP_055870634.1 lariat debranching enzyme B-like [Biomphalaria glabrata]XP_055870635.1 lariat debranching enzyme B-like [Biomphalaria glabrata]
MKIAVEGCCHGELDKIYETIKELEKQNGFKVDLLLICGDFQSVRNFDDLQAMAVPPKYQQLNTFYKYYSGEKVAPVLTVFIGGNHEASNYLQELPYGGWVAPNIYYMGYAGVIQVGGVRIGGISGIYKGHDYNKGHHECAPYDEGTKKSVYHVRNLEVFRLKQITRPVDIFLSHDWPRGIYHHGDTAGLIKKKPFFQKEIEDNKLGSWALTELMTHLKPTYWFSAHLHVKFVAHVQHEVLSDSQSAKSTKFLALDKCLPRRNFLQVVDVPQKEESLKIKLDAEWLSILQLTDHLLNLTPRVRYMPGPGGRERFDFKISEKEIENITSLFGNDLTLPENFQPTSPPLENIHARGRRQTLSVQVNPQTTLLCTMLEITDPNAKLLGKTSQELLDESRIGLTSRAEEDNSGDDVVDDDSDEDMPSTIDSTLDISGLSTSTSSNMDSFHTAKDLSLLQSGESLNLSTAATSTPYQSPVGVKGNPRNITIQDDDEEFLSILSAQKNKSSSRSLHDSDILCDEASAAAHTEPELKEADTSATDISAPYSLKSERSSLGMSGLCLDSSMLSSPPASFSLKKRSSDGGENQEVASEQLASEKNSGNGCAVKKFKRRNVSVYSEPSD